MVEVYTPLYRKYRPQQFSDLVGQDVISTALSNALELNKIAHAYLFCGPRGTGKTSSARIFAKSLNCQNGPTINPCQTCPSCTAITQGNALDVTEIDAASNNGVDQIRELTDRVQFSPIEGKYKIYIIDEVHMLSTAAFNALLKTLEEPPPNVVFIFATTEPHKVLPTIISRCQRFDLGRIARTHIETRLSDIAQQESILISPEALTLIAKHAKGGLRDALALLDQVAVLGQSADGKAIEANDVRSFIGSLPEEFLFNLVHCILEQRPDGLLQELQTLKEKGIEPSHLIKELIQHTRNLLIAQTCGANIPQELLDFSTEHYEKLCQQASQFSPEEIPQMMTRLHSVELQLKQSHQPQLWLEVALLELCYRDTIHQLQELAQRIEALEGGGIPTPQPTPTTPKPAPRQQTSIPQPPAAPPANPPAATPASQAAPKTAATPPPPAAATTGNDLPQLQTQIIQAIESPITKALIEQQCTLLAMDEQTLSFGFSNETILNTFNRPEKVSQLEKAIAHVLGKSYKVNLQVNSKTEQTPTPPKAPTPAETSTPTSVPPADKVPASVTTTPAPEATASSSAPSETPVVTEIDEAKQYTRDLLQGKLID